MSGDWKLIWRGLLIAALGAVAAMLYIVGLSAAYVARYATAIVTMSAGVALAVYFRSLLAPFIQQLVDRGGEQQQVDGND